jgi:F-type H+-transporting ATPase subunit delta
MANGNRPDTFDAQREQLAKTYAQALLAAAVAKGSAADTVDEVDSLVADVLDRNEQFDQALTGDMLSHDRRVELIDNVFGGRASEIVVSWLKVLSTNNRLQLVRPIARQLRRLFDESENRVKVTVRVASQASPATLDALRSAIAAKFGVEPILDVWIDPEIIGGVILRIGDTVYDASIRTSLNRAKSQMLARAVEAIESSPERFFEGSVEGPAA